jgi:hypothetical protein
MHKANSEPSSSCAARSDWKGAASLSSLLRESEPFHPDSKGLLLLEANPAVGLVA